MESGNESTDGPIRQRPRCMIVAFSFVLMLGVFTAGSGALAATPSQPTAMPRGYPILLSAGSDGVWFGGALEGPGRPETVDRVGYITPTSTFLDFPLPPELYGFWPEAFAPGGSSDEWFLARQEGEPRPILGEISLLGQIVVHHLQVPLNSIVRGLAVGPDGNLWMADTNVEQGKRESAILRVSPSGTLTAYKTGLQRDAIPQNIVDGPDGALWFIDTTGRIGRVDTSGAIKEYPVGHPIEGAHRFGPPPPIVAGADGAIWFVLNPRQLGRVTPSGQVRLFTPPRSLKGPRDRTEEAIEGLAVGPDHQLWFTRSSGAVLRIDSSGRVETVTNRLVVGRGIAVTNDGVVWVGEEAAFRVPDAKEVVPARLAQIGAGGKVAQYPEPPGCHVPFVLGDRAALATEELRGNYCELAAIRRPPRSHSHHLIVVGQSARAGAVVEYKAPIRLRLGPKPPPPKDCRAPRYVRVLAASTQLIAWKNPIVEPDAATGDGTQTYVACVPGHDTKHVFMTGIYESEYYAALGGLHTAGHFLAFTNIAVNHYNNGDYALVLFDALRGKAVFTVSYAFGEGSISTTFRSFALDPVGDIAWVKRVPTWTRVEGKLTRTGQVDKLQARYSGHVHLIDTGSSITGLALHDGVLDWVTAGTTHSLPLL